MRFLIVLILIAMMNFNCQNKAPKNVKFIADKQDTSHYILTTEAPPPPPLPINSEIEDTLIYKVFFCKWTNRRRTKKA